MKIFKYPLKNVDVQSIELPKGFKILHIAEQNDATYLWALVDQNSQDMVEAHITCYCTGEQTNATPGEHLRTVIYEDGRIVLHYFLEKVN